MCINFEEYITSTKMLFVLLYIYMHYYKETCFGFVNVDFELIIS